MLAWILQQRWFGSKSRELSALHVIGAPVVCETEPLLALAVVEIRFHAGTHELYHVPIGFRREWPDAIAEVEGWQAYDALQDPELVKHLIGRMRSQDDVAGGEAMLEFRWSGGPDAELGDVRLNGD